MPRRTERGHVGRLWPPCLAVLWVLGGCPCNAPAEPGGGDGAGSGGESAGGASSGRGDGEAGAGDDDGDPEGAGGGAKEQASGPDEEDAPRSQSDLPPPRSTRPSEGVRRASDPPAPAASERAPVEPPDGAPDNPFGYDRPVTGCLEGRIYLLPEPVRDIPRRWKGLEEGPALWACELNVEPRIWDDGLPGMGQRHQWFALRYEGAFRVTAPGTYAFRLRSDDGSRLLVDGELVVDNSGMHGARSRDGEIELEPGDHTMVVQYVQGAHHVALQLFVTPPDGEEGLLSVRWK